MSKSTDIQDLEQTRAALAESETRFQVMADSAPVLLWMSDVDKTRTWFNQVWLDFRGRSIEQERGDGWTTGVHPEDIDDFMKTHLTAFEQRVAFEKEYRLQRADGEYRWVLDRGTARYAGDGSFAGYVGSCTDVTNMKRIEVQLEQDHRLLRELVEANDRERRFVAHDIHDGLLQHVFAADMFVQSAMMLLSTVDVDTTTAKLKEAQALLAKAILDGRRMMNSLRPLILDEEGFVPALQHRVAELNESGSMQIELTVNNTIGRLHGVWEGNLFRIVDEAISNMIRHSQVSVGQVRFASAHGWVSVEVEDQGIGFDVSQVPADCFGIRSIIERTQVFKGNCRIDSCPGKGTLVSVSVPLPSSSSDYSGKQSIMGLAPS